MNTLLCQVVQVPAVRLKNHYYDVSRLFNFGGGGYLCRIHASYLYITSHLSGLGYHQAWCTCLDAALRPIPIDTCALHDVVVWYCFTIFCWSISRVLNPNSSP
jgi:hypothetical protein